MMWRATNVGLTLTVFGHTCQIAIYPFCWKFWHQKSLEDEHFNNYAFGPIRLMMHRMLMNPALEA